MGTPTTPAARKGQKRLARTVAIAMLLLGATSSFIGVATLQMDTVARFTQLGLAAGLTVFGLLLMVLRVRPWLLQLGVLWAVLAVSGMLATADDFGTTPFFYLWPAVYAAYFLSARFLVITMLVVIATLTGALVISPIDWAVKVDILIGTTLSTGLMATLVAVMHRRESELNDRLLEAARTDSLSEVLNRRGFDAPFAISLERALRDGDQLAVVMFDLDHFKLFNERHGLVAGDEALRRVAATLRRHARPVDLIARFGGEEFVVTLPGVDAKVARSYAERVAWALAAEPVEDGHQISVSSGVAGLQPDDTAHALLDRAGEGVLAAKAAGRNRAAAWVDGVIEVGDVIEAPVAQTLDYDLPSAGKPGELRPVPSPEAIIDSRAAGPRRTQSYRRSA